MDFGPRLLAEAEGCLLAHALRLGDATLRKGARLDAVTIARLEAAGFVEVTAARLGPGDVGENEAAALIAQRLAGAHLNVAPAFAGRCNIVAETAGVLRIDATQIDALNSVDESIAVATLPQWRRATPGEIVATVKIIPFALAADVLSRAQETLDGSALALAPFVLRRVGVLSTRLRGLKRATVAKTLRNLENRLHPAGATIADAVETGHDVDAVAAALRRLAPNCDLLVIFGASATIDHNDTIPTALRDAGGRVERFGMPVDPGNLLLLGACGAAPTIVAPGCARAPSVNGFDLVLDRLLAGQPLDSGDIARMGVGGLLGEIASRPQPRAAQPPAQDDAPLSPVGPAR